MPICGNATKTTTGKCCKVGLVDQPETEFINDQNGRTTRLCQTCRTYIQSKKKKREWGGERKKKNVIDPWLSVCDRCPIESGCVVPEGGIWQTERNYAKDHPIRQCPIFICTRLKEPRWTPDEALERADELKLLDPVEWLEM